MSVILKAQDATIVVGKQMEFTEWKMLEDDIIINVNILRMAKWGKKKNTKTRLTLTMDGRYHRIKCEICLDLWRVSGSLL